MPVLFVSISVIIAWITESSSLEFLFYGHSSMKFVTALCMFLSSISTISNHLSVRVFSSILIMLTVYESLLVSSDSTEGTFLSNFFDRPDMALMPGVITISLFALKSIVKIYQSSKENFDAKYFGFLGIGVSFIVLLGHFFDQPLLRGGKENAFEGTSALTALCFIYTYYVSFVRKD